MYLEYTDGMDIIATTDIIAIHHPGIFPLVPPGSSLTTLLIHARTNDDRSPSTPPVPSTPVSLSIKLPRLLVLLCLLPKRPRPDLLLPLELDVAPPTQRKTVERKRQATAAHIKPKLYFPRLADVPADLNALRPSTNAALCSVSVLRVKGRSGSESSSRH